MTAFSERKADHVMKGPDPLAEDVLFELEAPPRVTLHDRFIVPPFSCLDRRAGYWQDRRRDWLSLGIKSEVGRDDHLTFRASLQDVVDGHIETTSIFDPVVCELTYRWFTAPGGRVLDPFAGGSVRGIVASTLGRWYTGLELRQEQVEANALQARLGSDITPQWIHTDSMKLDDVMGPGDEFDLVFSCPPYADLEVYSDDPADLSNMPYDKFLEAYEYIIARSVAYLRPDRFAVWAISDVRNKKDGTYRGLVADSVKAFEKAGLALYNDAIILDPVNTASVRAPVTFATHRKLARVHQHLLIFVKGDPKKAAAYAKSEGTLE